mmetsp:Transcript_89431/g.142380  ORF Transcript_89431/g.142380 Transcript_89431/m.142380 type:complete len:200 (-) Transcript_89431:440-1039(-)
MAVCACWRSSSGPESSEKAPSSSLLSSPSTPSHSQTRPQTQVIFRQPSLRCVGTPQPGQSWACLAFSVLKRSLQVTPRCQDETLQRKQNCSPQQRVRCRGKRFIQASCMVRRRSKSSIQFAWPMAPKTFPMLLGGAPPLRWPQENSSKTACRKFSAGTSARKNSCHARHNRSCASTPNIVKGYFPTFAGSPWGPSPALK